LSPLRGISPYSAPWDVVVRASLASRQDRILGTTFQPTTCISFEHADSNSSGCTGFVAVCSQKTILVLVEVVEM
jgi:hypothetical protein